MNFVTATRLVEGRDARPEARDLENQLGAEELQKLLSGGRARLADMAARARSVAIVDADVRLADACDAVAGGAR